MDFLVDLLGDLSFLLNLDEEQSDKEVSRAEETSTTVKV